MAAQVRWNTVSLTSLAFEAGEVICVCQHFFGNVHVTFSTRMNVFFTMDVTGEMKKEIGVLQSSPKITGAEAPWLEINKTVQYIDVNGVKINGVVGCGTGDTES